MDIKDNISDEQYNDALDSMCGYQNEQVSILLKNFKYVLSNIGYPSENIEEYLRDGENFHIGFCRVKKSDFKSTWYPNHDFYTIDGEIEGSERVINVNLMRQDDNKDDAFHSLVYQTCSGEDCYSGYILFPLVDGRYWILSYSC